MMFHILHIVSSERWTGAAEPVSSLALYQQKLGCQVWLACLPGRSFERIAKGMGLRLVTDFYLNRRLHPIHFVRDLKRIKRFILENKINIVHTHLPHDHWLAALALRRLSRKRKLLLVRTVHRPGLAPGDPFHKALFKNHTDLIITLYQQAKKEIVDKFRLNPERVDAIYGGVDLEKFRPAGQAKEIRERLNIPLGSLVAGIATRLRRDRGLEWLLKAMPLVLDRLPDTYLIIVGRGEMKYPLRRLIPTLPFGQHIKMAGYQTKELPKYYNAFDVSLFLGLGSEASCRAILEAMATALPVIGVAKGPVGEIIKDGETGLLVPENDNQALADAVVEILSDQEKARKMGHRARQRVEQHFTEPQRAQLTLQAYQKTWQLKFT